MNRSAKQQILEIQKECSCLLEVAKPMSYLLK